MLSIALSITGIVLFNAILSSVGHTVIASFLYTAIFTYILPSNTHKQQAALKKEILDGRRELANTSAQDEFSKWARIRRKVDKQVVELEALNNSLASHKSTYNRYSKGLLFILTSGLQWYFTTSHRKSAIVYLPKDWFGPLTWFLGLPFAPTGALSTGVYIFLLRRVINIVIRISSDVWTGLRGEPSEVPAVAVPVSAGKADKPSLEKKKQ